MPARLPTGSAALASTLESLTLSSSSSTTSAFTRSFSTTTCRGRMTRERQRMYQWLQSREGVDIKNNERRYLGPYADQPFPVNPLFRSQPVLDERTRELVWERVTKRGEALKVVSADMGVDVRRIAAVVRLKQVEKQWVADGKKLAKPYSRAMLDMLPTTRFEEGSPDNVPHEPVNDVHVHRYTLQQLFVPVSESREFDREDAAKAFHPTMLSVDARSPQQGLIKMEKEVLAGKDRSESKNRFVEREQKQEEKVATKLAEARLAEEAATKRVRTDRYEFRFKEVNVDDVGPTGKSRKGTGERYGAPYNDRKRGAIKIPMSVE